MISKEIKPNYKDDWCPSMGGTYPAYKPIWNDDGIWKDIEFTTDDGVLGIPPPKYSLNGISQLLNVLGYEQAMAISWQFSAINASQGIIVEVDVQEYQVIYDIKAKKIDRKNDI